MSESESTTLSPEDIEVTPAAPADAHFYTGDRDPSDPLVEVNNRRNGDLMY